MNDVSDGILKRIRALLARRSDTSNEQEAGNAALLLQDLLAKYNLEESDVAEAAGVDFIEDVLWAQSNKPWRRDLQAAIARLYFCDSYWGHSKKKTAARACGYIRYDGFVFVGLPHNIAVAKEMFQYLVDTVERLATETEKARVYRGSKSSYLRDFKEGCASRLIERINDRWYEATHPPERSLLAGNKLPALYKATDDKLTAFMKEKHGELTETDRKDVTRSQEGRMAGYQKGGTIGLDTQIGSEAASHALPKGSTT